MKTSESMSITNYYFSISISVILLAVGLSSCFTSQSLGKQTVKMADEFVGRYDSFVPPGERLIKNWYNYVTSRNSIGQIVKRTFYPETKVMTKYEVFADEDMLILEGDYKEWFDDGTLRLSGKYRRNNRIGEWKYYSFPEGTLNRQGRYNEGIQAGKWKFYNNEGELTKEVLYENGEIKEEMIVDEILNKTFSEEAKEGHDEMVETMPYMASCANIENVEERMKCSNQALLTSIYSNIKYPVNERQYGVEGTAIVQFVVDKTGSITDFTVLTGITAAIVQSVKDAVDQLPPWNPGLQDGEPVDVIFTLPVRFKLE